MHADFLFQLIYLPYFNIRNCSWHLPPHESENMNVHDYFGLIAVRKLLIKKYLMDI